MDSALSAQSLRTDELAADGYTVYRQFSTQIGATRKFTQTCLTCGKKGHTAEVCRSGDKGYGNKKRRRNGGKGNGGKGKGLAESKELKAKLKALGLPTKGSKSELKERLKEGEFKAARKRRSSAPATSMAV
mgnify:CR=1 FL=1